MFRISYISPESSGEASLVLLISFSYSLFSVLHSFLRCVAAAGWLAVKTRKKPAPFFPIFLRTLIYSCLHITFFVFFFFFFGEASSIFLNCFLISFSSYIHTDIQDYIIILALGCSLYYLYCYSVLVYRPTCRLLPSFLHPIFILCC